MQHDRQLYPNPGKPPRLRDPSTLLFIVFRNGTTGLYLSHHLRWKPWDWCPEHPGDVVQFGKA